nr:CpsB/CapC family capsule biosynthesis tyrosine phosphatase [Clostridium muellerianum]
MDLHNHTIWSDGTHSPEKIIENAIEHKLTAVGISDHFQTDKCASVSIQNLNNYIKDLERLKYKYRDKIQVYSGIEICMHKDLCDLNNLPYDHFNKLDYVLLEYIDCFKKSIKLNEIEQYTKNLKCSIGLAHTDLLHFYKNYGLNFLINKLKRNNLFWELNVNEGYEYFDEIVSSIDSWKTKRLFKHLKKNDIKISVGSDTHCLDSYNIEKLKIANMLCKHKSIKILKYDFSISRALKLNNSITSHYGI